MKIRLTGGIIGIIVFLAFAFMEPREGLSGMQMRGIGVFLCAVVWWMTNAFDDYIVALLMAAFWIGIGVLPVGQAMSGFASSTIWILIGAMGLAAATNSCGLLRRLALAIMDKFPLTYMGQTLGMYVTGMVMAPLIPSTNARLVVMAPLCKMISDQMGFQDKSKGASGLFASMFLAHGGAGQATFLTGSSVGYLVIGLLPKEFGVDITWTTWLLLALPWGLTVLIAGLASLMFFYKPDEVKKVTSSMIREELNKLGSMSKKEKICTVVLAGALLLWMTEAMHGINAAAVSMGAMSILMGSGILDRTSVRAGIPWDAVLFIGVLIGISSAFKVLTIDKITSAFLGGYLQPLIDYNIFIFILLASCLVYVVRFILPSQVAGVTIFTLLLVPFAVQAGIHPWIMGFLAYVSGNIFVVMYQNVTYVTAFYAANNGEMVAHKDMLILAFTYLVVSILGLWVSVPIWKMMGYFG